MTHEHIHPEPAATPYWLHLWAVQLVCAALVLLVLGSLVTTLRAGMADRYWPTHPLFLARADIVAEAERQGYALLLFALEHSHRAAGWFVGLDTIILCLGLWLFERRRWVCWLGTAALLAVSLEGVLGGLRVLLNEWAGTDLATVHGSFAQLVFALLVILAVVTGPGWGRGQAGASRWYRLILGVCALIYVQVIFGAIVRHSHPRLAQRLHVLTAFVVFAAVFVLMTALRDVSRLDWRVRWTGRLLSVFLTLQIVLGVEAWLMRFGRYVVPELLPFSMGDTVVRTLHFTFGTMLFASAVVLAVLGWEPKQGTESEPASRKERVLEGVA